MVTLDDLKDYLNVDYNDDNAKLQRKLNSAVRVVERYTNHSLSDKVITYTSNGHCREFYQYPIESVLGAVRVEYKDLSVIVYAKDGDIVTIDLGVSDEPNLDEAVLRIAATLYENIEISEVNLPLDVQLLLNKFRRDSFLD